MHTEFTDITWREYRICKLFEKLSKKNTEICIGYRELVKLCRAGQPQLAVALEKLEKSGIIEIHIGMGRRKNSYKISDRKKLEELVQYGESIHLQEHVDIQPEHYNRLRK